LERPPATVSVDVDPVDLHLVGYGHRSEAADDRVYALAIPRLLERFDRARLRATFFFVARDAAAQSRALAAVRSAGHEIASHSLTHPMPFQKLPAAELAREVAESKRRLETAVGSAVFGFRAPNWDVGPRVLAALADAGYRYDASAFATPLQAAARVLLAVKGRDRRALTAMSLFPFTLARRPFRWRAGARELVEFPVSTTRWLRVPVYHTARYFGGDAAFRRRLDAIARRGEPLSYPLHAVDALGLAEDSVDRRLGAHPGMDRALASKLALLDSALAAITERFEVKPFAELLARVP